MVFIIVEEWEQKCFHPLDQRHAHLEEDSLPFSGTASFSGNGSQLQRPQSSGGLRPSNFRGTGQALINGSGSATTREKNQFQQAAAASASFGQTNEVDRSIGFKVRDGDANGVVVYRVSPGEAAERAGVRTGDVIIYVNNRPSRSIAEFRQVINNSTGPISLQVRRRGVQKLLLTVHR